MLYVIIMAGGQGMRLWPESHEGRPKQFIPLKYGRPLILEAAESLGGLVPREQTFVVTRQSMKPLVSEAITWLPDRNIITEPVGRNTAPCLGLAAIHLLREDPDATMIVLSSDHLIEPRSAFCDTVHFTTELIEESTERLVMITVKPTFASTTYGYIERSNEINSKVCQKWSHTAKAYNVSQFHEKPDQQTAEKYLRQGNFGWNAGIFVWKAQRIYDLISKYQPEMRLGLEKISNVIGTSSYQNVLELEFEQMTGISIDYAVLEKADSSVCIDAPICWEDIGSWKALTRIFPCQQDQADNVITNARVVAVNSHNNHVRGINPSHDIVLVGVDNLFIVQSDRGMLIADKSDEEAIRQAIEQLKTKAD